MDGWICPAGSLGCEVRGKRKGKSGFLSGKPRTLKIFNNHHGFLNHDYFIKSTDL